VLGLLPSSSSPGLWLTAAGIAWVLGVHDVVADMCLRSLRRRGLVVGDGRDPEAFARPGDARPTRRNVRRAARARRLAEVRLAGSAG